MSGAGWLRLLRPGDALTLAAGLAVVAFAFAHFWQGGGGERAVVHQAGRIVGEYDLRVRRELRVKGPLGDTVIAIEPGRARVVADPGPRQYCVRQGWLTRPGEIALCAPNRVSLQVAGRTRVYDALSY